LLRKKLDRLQVRRAAELSTLRSGSKVRVAGIVTHRQRPETASGVIFMSLEDETGIKRIPAISANETGTRQARHDNALLPKIASYTPLTPPTPRSIMPSWKKTAKHSLGDTNTTYVGLVEYIRHKRRVRFSLFQAI
jgi:hypothetical protein